MKTLHRKRTKAAGIPGNRLAEDYPIHMLSAWLDNTPRIAVNHSLQITDDDFARGAGKSYGASST